jgi:hypothetical protein
MIALCLLAVTSLLVIPVSANLASTVFGFPVITQNGASSAFNQNVANVADTETLHAGVPMEWTGLKMGPPQPGKFNLLGFNFDTFNGDAFYGQSSNQAIDTSSTHFAQTSEGANFAYPFEGVGAISIPGFGFGT